MTETTDELALAGDPDAQQADPEADFDINEQHPEAAGMVLDPGDIVSMAKAIEAGVPIVALAEAHEAQQLTTHTWSPGEACPMRSRNRKVGSLTSIYNLRHPENTIVPPAFVVDGNWLARCETHNAELYSSAFAPAWKARNRPWTFCLECEAIYNTRHGGKVASKSKTKSKRQPKTVAVATKTPKPKASKKTEVVSDERFETTEDLKAAGIPGTIQGPSQEVVAAAEASESKDDDLELAAWNEWSQRLAKEAPKGATVDWISPYHYAVTLADKRQIEFRVHKGVATFKFHNDATGKDAYTDNLKQMLAAIG